MSWYWRDCCIERTAESKLGDPHGSKSIGRAVSFTIRTIILLAFTLTCRAGESPSSSESAPTPVRQLASFKELLNLSSEQVASYDIATLNLLCAEGLPGVESLSLQSQLATLDRWAKRVQSETERHLYMFRRAPHKFRNIEGFYRMQMLITVLMLDLGVGYNPARDSSPDNPEPGEIFFANSRDLFIHGLLDAPHLGTCASLPVLYVAVGRKLGYPLKLVTAKSHLFARWENADGTERFNIEGTNKGMNSYEDEHYRTFPRPMSDEEVRTGQYLRSLTPAEELAVFLSTRGICLQVNGRLTDAKEAYMRAHALAPSIHFYAKFVRQKVLNPNIIQVCT